MTVASQTDKEHPLHTIKLHQLISQRKRMFQQKNTLFD